MCSSTKAASRSRSAATLAEGSGNMTAPFLLSFRRPASDVPVPHCCRPRRSDRQRSVPGLVHSEPFDNESVTIVGHHVSDTVLDGGDTSAHTRHSSVEQPLVAPLPALRWWARPW